MLTTVAASFCISYLKPVPPPSFDSALLRFRASFLPSVSFPSTPFPPALLNISTELFIDFDMGFQEPGLALFLIAEPTLDLCAIFLTSNIYLLLFLPGLECFTTHDEYIR